jgi:hypothetical protein
MFRAGLAALAATVTLGWGAMASAAIIQSGSGIAVGNSPSGGVDIVSLPPKGDLQLTFHYDPALVQAAGLYVQWSYTDWRYFPDAPAGLQWDAENLLSAPADFDVTKLTIIDNAFYGKVYIQPRADGFAATFYGPGDQCSDRKGRDFCNQVDYLEILGFHGVVGEGKLLPFSWTLTSAPLGGVPEPATWALLIAGFGLVGGALRHRRCGLA